MTHEVNLAILRDLAEKTAQPQQADESFTGWVVRTSAARLELEEMLSATMLLDLLYERDQLRETVQAAQHQFNSYARAHWAEGTPGGNEDAEVNHKFSLRCEAVLTIFKENCE
jgi:hypothetical protein